MKAVFADTFFFVALLDKRDQHHRRVRDYARGLQAPIITTRWVFAETANALAASAERSATAAFLGDAETHPRIRVVGSSDESYARGLKHYALRPDKHWSLTDCISFVVMSEATIFEALTRDHHFEQAGFHAIFAD